MSVVNIIMQPHLKKEKFQQSKLFLKPHLKNTVSPALYHGIFMLKSNVDTPIELDAIMCAN